MPRIHGTPHQHLLTGGHTGDRVPLGSANTACGDCVLYLVTGDPRRFSSLRRHRRQMAVAPQVFAESAVAERCRSTCMPLRQAQRMCIAECRSWNSTTALLTHIEHARAQAATHRATHMDL